MNVQFQGLCELWEYLVCQSSFVQHFGVLVSTCLVQESANTKGDHTNFWAFFLYNYLFWELCLTTPGPSASVTCHICFLPSFPGSVGFPPPPSLQPQLEMASNRKHSSAGLFVSFFLKDSSQCLKPVVSCFVQVSSCLLQEVKYSPCYFFIAKWSLQFFIVMVKLVWIFTYLPLHIVLDTGVPFKFGKSRSSECPEEFSYAFTNFLSTVILIIIFLEFLLDIGYLGWSIHFSYFFLFSISLILLYFLWDLLDFIFQLFYRILNILIFNF